eukprot:237921_1
MEQVLLLLFTVFTHISQSNTTPLPVSVCLIGDVQAQYDQQYDPRTLMGTYTMINKTGLTLDEEIVDTTTPIYKHSHYFNSTQVEFLDQHEYLFSSYEYLFKAKHIGEGNGWVISDTLPTGSDSARIRFTCFQESLFNCIYYKWFGGYNSYEYSIPKIKVLGGDCTEEMCLKNLTIQLMASGDINKLNPQPGAYSKLDGEFYRLFDNQTRRYQWINKRNN